MKYYNGTKLITKKDINGKRAEIFLASGNRTSGKTTWFYKKLVEDFLKDGTKFILLYRFNNEMDDVADKFFKDINGLFFKEKKFESKSMSKGIYHNLFLDGIHCGYAMAINNADQIKKMSHLFSDAGQMYFDEFQSETNHYCPNEITKFISVHQSVARGQGEMSRYVPVYMCSNCVSLLNPYYVALGVCDRLQVNTKFLRGDGFVLEQNFNPDAAMSQHDSAFNRAFTNNKYIAYGAQNIYLNDDYSFIETPNGKSSYMATIRYKGQNFGIRKFPELGLVHCSPKADLYFPVKLSVTTEDHKVNYVMLKQHEFLIFEMRYYFDNGAFRFKNLQSKEAILKAISY